MSLLSGSLPSPPGLGHSCPGCTCSFLPVDLEEASPEWVFRHIGDELQPSRAPGLSCGERGRRRIPERFSSGEVDPVGSLGLWLAVPCQCSRETGDTGWALPAPTGPVAWSMYPCLSLSISKSGLLASKPRSSAFSPGCQAVGWSSSGAGQLLSFDLAASREGCAVSGLCVPQLRTLRSCWEPGLPCEAVPAGAGELRALV